MPERTGPDEAPAEPTPDAGLRAMVETLPAVVYMDEYASGVTTYVSPQVEALTGYTPADFASRPGLWKEIVHPEDKQRVREMDRRWRDGREPWRMEYRLVRRDGSVVWIHDEAVLLTDASGSPTHWQGVWVDITERKRTELEIARRDAISDAVAFAAHRFLVGVAWAEEVPTILERLGVATGSARTYLYENVPAPDGLVGNLRADWSTAGVRPVRDDPENLEWPYARGLLRWQRELAAGRVIHGPISSFPTEERAVLEGGTVGSLLVAPVFVGGEWWGYLGFDDTQPYRHWTVPEIDALQAAADTLGAAIQREQAQLALYDAEQRHRALIEQIPAVLYVDLPGETMQSTYVGPQVESVLGISQREWLDDPSVWEKRIHPEDREQTVANYLRMTREADGGFLEYRFIRPDGREIWIQDRFTVLRDDADNPRLIQGVMFDATDQKQAEHDLRAAERRYRILVEQIPAVVYIDPLEETQPTLYVSPQVEDVFGYPAEDWTSDPLMWWNILHPDDREHAVERWHHSRDTGLPYSDEYRVVARDGRVVWIREEAVILRDDEGNPAFIQGVMLDITERKHAEQELHDALEREREAARHLRMLDAFKNTLLHAVSHDLRGPLAGVLGAVALLGDERLPDGERQAVLRDLEMSATKMNRLIEDLLDMDRIDRGLLDPHRVDTDLGALASQVVGEVRRDRDVEPAMGEITIDTGPEPLVVSIDRPRVERILENLLRNAVRHTPARTPVWVRAWRVARGVEIAVEDAGPGVPAPLRSKIFEPFARGTESEGGAGVGLSLVLRFAELHGGHAWVEDREGGGASFRVFLPG